MAFRDAPDGSDPAADPLARYRALAAAIERPSGFLTDRVPLRLAAINLVPVAGDPDALAGRFYAIDAALARRLGVFSGTSAAVRQVIAAQLLKHGDDPDRFLDEVARVNALFRDVGLRRGGVYETLAALILRRVLHGAATERAHIERLAALYAEMKRHHWWLTGPDDFPACAMLLGHPGTPTEIGDRIEAIYQTLRRDADLWPGEALQTAANVLYLAGLEPAELAARFVELTRAFRAAGAKIGQDEYDELALLCFVAQPVARIVETVIGYRDSLTGSEWFVTRTNFGLATNLALVRIAGQSGALDSLADAKLLLDMQSIVAYREASGTT